MKYLKFWRDFDVLYVVELDEPTNACSPQIVYPVSILQHGVWDSTHMTKADIKKNYGTVIQYNREADYDEFDKEFFDLIVGNSEQSGFKSSVVKNRIEKYGLAYAKGDYVRIKNTAQLEAFGLDSKEIQALGNITGKVFVVDKGYSVTGQYALDGLEIVVCEDYIYEVIHPSGEW
ncbi:MAG: hypothetical protein DRN14_05330 [Thermoplasmata archaeon]|nr:MAG: hypothetical protein DRN14_05330 [Thermoplasmata archaeon]